MIFAWTEPVVVIKFTDSADSVVYNGEGQCRTTGVEWATRVMETQNMIDGDALMHRKSQ